MDSITQVAQEMQHVLSVEADQLGRESGFVQRQSKLGGAEFAQTLTFGWLSNPQASLEELAQTAASLGVVITPQGLDQRFTSAAADCLTGVLEEAVKRVVCASSPAAQPILQRFPAVYLQDSSVIKLPEELSKVWQGCGDRSGMGQAACRCLPACWLSERRKKWLIGAVIVGVSGLINCKDRSTDRTGLGRLDGSGDQSAPRTFEFARGIDPDPGALASRVALQAVEKSGSDR